MIHADGGYHALGAAPVDIDAERAEEEAAKKG
jgi:hypothetical protein